MYREFFRFHATDCSVGSFSIDSHRILAFVAISPIANAISEAEIPSVIEQCIIINITNMLKDKVKGTG